MGPGMDKSYEEQQRTRDAGSARRQRTARKADWAESR